jgi:hypothetical protein
LSNLPGKSQKIDPHKARAAINTTQYQDINERKKIKKLQRSLTKYLADYTIKLKILIILASVLTEMLSLVHLISLHDFLWVIFPFYQEDKTNNRQNSNISL